MLVELPGKYENNSLNRIYDHGENIFTMDNFPPYE